MGLSRELGFVCEDTGNGFAEFVADLVFVPLEDGDRCEALRAAGKEVITVDLNPASRTAESATIAIVDNIVRAVPILSRIVQDLKATATPEELADNIERYEHTTVLAAARRQIVDKFSV